MDLGLKLREMRRRAGLRQSELAARSGISVKSISSWETGARHHSVKFEHVERLVAACGWTMAEFVAPTFERVMLEPPARSENLRRVS
ncbi:MAG: helix-turn-helix transcriptional regulator [Thermoanaerobaculia bacterium]